MSDTAPLISVVIPCHNAELWLEETLRSVLAQAVSTELVVVDDGSSDRSVEIAESVGGRALRLIRQSRAGVSRARNVGTAAARGTFIQYLDADDALTAGSLAPKLLALTDTGADVAYSDWVYWQERPDGSFGAGETIRRTLGPRPDVEIFLDKWWPLGALLYRRSLVDRLLPWREDLPIIQDARFLLDAALAGGRFVHVPIVGARYRVHLTSLSRRDPREFLEDCYRNGSELHHRWEREGTFDAERRHGMVRLYDYLARSFFPIDRGRFAQLAREVTSLEPGFVPGASPSLRTFATLFGYPSAEYLAGWWRVARANLTRTRRSVNPAAAGGR